MLLNKLNNACFYLYLEYYSVILLKYRGLSIVFFAL